MTTNSIMPGSSGDIERSRSQAVSSTNPLLRGTERHQISYLPQASLVPSRRNLQEGTSFRSISNSFSSMEQAGLASFNSNRMSNDEQRPSLPKTDNTDGIVPTLHFQETVPEIGMIYRPDKRFKIIGYQAAYTAAKWIDCVPQRFASQVIDTGFRVLNNESRMVGEVEGSLLDIVQSQERIFFIEQTRNWTKPTPKDPNPVYPYEAHLIEEMVYKLLQTKTIDAWVSMIPGLTINKLPSLSESAKRMYQRLIDSADEKGIVVLPNSKGQFVVQRKGEKSLLAYTE